LGFNNAHVDELVEEVTTSTFGFLAGANWKKESGQGVVEACKGSTRA